MQYYHLNADCKDEYDSPVVMKVSSKAEELAGRMGKLVRQHRALERQLMEEMSKINKITKSEIGEFMAKYDFLVDASQYGVGIEIAKNISKEEYEKLRKKMTLDEEYEPVGELE